MTDEARPPGTVTPTSVATEEPEPFRGDLRLLAATAVGLARALRVTHDPGESLARERFRAPLAEAGVGSPLPVPPEASLAQDPGGVCNTPPNGQAQGLATSNHAQLDVPEPPEGGGWVNGQPPPRCVGNRVDWLSLAFRVEIPPHVLAQLRARAEVAREAGVAVEWCLPSGVTLGLRPSRKGDWFGFEGADTAGVVDLKASGGWNVAIEISGERCARMNVRAAMAAAARVAQAIGEGVVDGVRLRRVDLAGDFAGWVIAAEDGAGLVTRRRAGVAAFYEEDDTAPATRTYTQTGRATGHTVCAGNPLMARIYDKRAQLRAAGDTEREAQEVSTWVANGTTDSDAVTRVEFQLRSEVLAEFPVENGVLRDRPDLLEKSLDSLWQYCTQRWLRLAIPGTATRRKNWTTDPRWSVAQAVTFTHRSDVAKRERRVGRAAAAQAFGCAVSALADGGRIGRVDPAQANETSAEVFVRGTVDRVMRDAGESFAAQLLEKFKHENDPAAAAARWLAEKLNGAIALRSE